MKNKLLGKEVKVLDKGFIRLIDYMGDDSSIVQAARVSYGQGTKSVREDQGLINYLMRNHHTSPFEMVEYKFHMKLPIFVARQIVRHRTANINEYSGRYSEMKDEYYIPDKEQIYGQDIKNKQGRNEELMPDIKEGFIVTSESLSQEAFEEYKTSLSFGVARELARITLPLNTYTEWYWKIDLHNLLHFLKLRLDDHAQWETRQYALVIADIVKQLCPMTWKAFEEYELNSVNLSKSEVDALKYLISKLDLINITNPENEKINKQVLHKLNITS